MTKHSMFKTKCKHTFDLHHTQPHSKRFFDGLQKRSAVRMFSHHNHNSPQSQTADCHTAETHMYFLLVILPVE